MERLWTRDELLGDGLERVIRALESDEQSWKLLAAMTDYGLCICWALRRDIQPMDG